jgi:hypothetical protein
MAYFFTGGIVSPHNDSFTASGNSPTSRPDFICSGYGSLYLLRPLNQTARLWIETHIHPEHQTFADSVVIEHRYIQSILIALNEDSLEVPRG